MKQSGPTGSCTNHAVRIGQGFVGGAKAEGLSHKFLRKRTSETNGERNIPNPHFVAELDYQNLRWDERIIYIIKSKDQTVAVCCSGLNPCWYDIAQELDRVSSMAFVTNTLFKLTVCSSVFFMSF